MTTGGAVSYYLKDHLGSVRAVVNSSGTVLETRDYYPYGLEMPGRSYLSGTKAKENFTGYELDDESGLHYAGARYYMPNIGRFTSIDRFKEKYPGLSPYQYAANNPLRFIDVNGDSIVVAFRPIRLPVGVGNVSTQNHAYLVHFNEETGATTTIAEATNVKGKLVAGVVSNVSDGDTRMFQTIDLPEGVTEAEFLETVFGIVSNYDDQTNYPTGGISCATVSSPCANSNSFLGNVLRRAGVDIDPDAPAPLWDRNALPGDRSSNPPNPSERVRSFFDSFFQGSRAPRNGR